MLMSKLIKYNSVRLPLASIANSFVQLVVRKELSTNRNELAAFKGNFNRKNNRNQLRKSQDRQDSYEKKFIFRGKSNQYIEKIDDEESLDEKPELEEDLELFSRNENTYHKKVIDEDIKQRKRIKYGIIKKKMSTLEGYTHSYFNLLSWDAKEQIKYLNLNEPDYWTVEKICESFPITEENCRKLLRSKWTPKTLDDLSRHDEKVIENWKKLTSSENTEPSGPAINIYEEYKKSNRLALLKNACGLPDVEFKRKTLIFNDSFSIHESVLCKPGIFSKLITRDKESIKKLFEKNNDPLAKQLDSSVNKQTAEKRSSSVEDHLVLTKQELYKSLEKLTVEIKNNNSIAKNSK